MPDLAPADFIAFFRALWGHDPFPWQVALAERVLMQAGNPWPEAIAVPTAAGKTACIDIGVFALAAHPRPSPRRIWFVVDRRIIVDEAHERARSLAGKLAAAQEGIVHRVAESLRRISESKKPLMAFLLRGGVYRDDAWARAPLQASVISSTVDQFGSRLLFRAYGRSHRAWPIQAGLAGNDSLVLLDEAHCARPFLETLRAVSRYRALGTESPGAPFHAVVLSATPPGDVTDRQDLQAADREHPVLGPRLAATKPARLLEPVSVRGADPTEAMAGSLADAAVELVDREAGRLAIVVFCNRVATAHRTHELLRGLDGFDSPVLLTGRMRPIDKDAVIQGWLGKLSAERSSRRCLERPVVVVATQTLEVGANLDFDGLVSECASLDALRQRLGRLNRMGRPLDARATLAVADRSLTDKDDPIYGPALALTWEWLHEQGGRSGEIDFGVEALGRLLPVGDDLTRLSAPAAHAAVLLPTHVDALAQTSPVPMPSPEPSLFLHGAGRGAADVQVCWRGDLEPQLPETWVPALTLCPPTSAECLPVPYWRMRAWLADTSVSLDFGDVEGSSDEESTEEMVASGRRRIVRWVGREDSVVIADPSALRPGDVLVVPSAFGGFEGLGGHRPEDASLDRGEQANREARGSTVLRLHSAVMADWPKSEGIEALITLARDVERRAEDTDGWHLDLGLALARLGGEELTPAWSWLPLAAKDLAGERNLARTVIEHPSGGVVLQGTKRFLREGDGGFTDEDDVTASGLARIVLSDHLCRVSGRARLHASAVGLPAPLVEALSTAAANHDIGKADPRFQSWLNGGRTPLGELLAKSMGMPQGRRESRNARRLAGYPEGGRHELLSARLMEAVGMGPEADLLRHLVESHHGHCRPFAPVVIDPAAPVVIHPAAPQVSASAATGLERLDSGVAERFWTLTRRFGWWGLAWLEALVRLADHIESAEEQR